MGAVCVVQANKVLDKYTTRCVLYLENFCLRCPICGDAVFASFFHLPEALIFEQALSVLLLDTQDH